MPYWKENTGAQTPFAPHASLDEKQVTRLTALEVVVLVITFLAFVGQFINLAYALVDHNSIRALTREVKALGARPS